MVKHFNKQLVSNFLSLGIMGGVGLCLNLLIIKFYGPEGLGLFNFIFSLFIVLSQFSVFGLHYSALKFSSQHAADHIRLQKILTNAIILSCLFCVPVAFISFIIPRILPFLFKFENSRESFYLVIPGLIFFSINKIFLAFINGQQKMHWYAFLSSFRYIGMLACFGGVYYFNMPALSLSLILTIPEFFLLLICIFVLRSYINFDSVDLAWIKSHGDFSLKSFLAGASIELNSRIDVVMLSCLSDEKSVGLYSFSLFLVEGFLQITAVFRSFINPIITQLFFQRNFHLLKKEMHSIGLKVFLLLGLIFPFIAGCFYLYVGLYYNIIDSFYIFLILMSGVVIAAYYLPFQFFPSQTGHPTDQSKLNFFILLSNVFLNLIFIYFFGLYGAAIATALSFIVTMYIIRRYVKKCFQKFSFCY